MSRYVLSSTKWKKWYPNDFSMKEKVIKNKLSHRKDKSFIDNSKKIVKTSSEKNSNNFNNNIIVVNNSSNNSCQKKEILINKRKKESKVEKLNTQLLFEKKFSIFEKEKIEFFKNVEVFLEDFKFSLESLEKLMSFKLVRLVLKIVKKIVGETNSLVTEKKLISKIKENLNKDFMIFKKLELHIHPDNKLLVEDNFREIFSTNEWKIVGNIDVDKGGCKIFFSNGGRIDSCINTIWEELCQLIIFRD